MSDTFDLGGSGGTTFSWGKPAVDNLPGAYVQGTVLDMKEVQKSEYVEGGGVGKPEFWDNGDPKMQYRVTLQTELRDPTNAADDGKRDVYLDGRRKANDDGTKSKLCAVLDAVRAVTGGTQLQRGGKLTLQWTSGMGFSGDPRCYTAWYEAPALNLGGTPPPGVAPAAPPVQAAPPAVAPQTVQQAIATQGPPPAFAAAPPMAGPGPMPTAPPPQTQQQAPPVQQGPTPEAIAALQAAGVDPAQVYPGMAAPARRLVHKQPSTASRPEGEAGRDAVLGEHRPRGDPTVHEYGPNQPEEHPATVVWVHLGAGVFEERDIGRPPALEAQRKTINDLAYAGSQSESSTAVVSDCGRYRYHLTRRWAPGPLLPFLMCNPSTADHLLNDNTIVRCRGFAEGFGFGGMEALNAYAWKATKPADLWAAQRAGHDIVGPDNDGWLTDLFHRALTLGIPVIAAWGAHPKPDRVAQVLALPHADRLQSLGVTQSGQPRHPLMLRADTPLSSWPPVQVGAANS
jgi:hypothetical protein